MKILELHANTLSIHISGAELRRGRLGPNVLDGGRTTYCKRSGVWDMTPSSIIYVTFAHLPLRHNSLTYYVYPVGLDNQAYDTSQIAQNSSMSKTEWKFE